jgi:uncharacterized protein YdhG (YjbR/CyaY superfamily)
MAEKASAKKGGKAAAAKPSKGFTAEEREAMKARVREVKAEARRARGDKGDGEGEVLAKIAELPEPDRTMAQRLHDIVTASAPNLVPRLWYGMPAYAKDGNVVCFFQSGQKFKTRYASLGFSDKAQLDDGAMWPNSFALKALTAVEAGRIAALVKKAVS